jgi:predicted PurR-regulated permease PerM
MSDLGSATRVLIAIAAVIVVIAGIKAAAAIMVPFLLAAFIAILAGSPVYWLERHKVPVPIAITTVMVVILMILVAVGLFIAQSVTDFTAALPSYQERLSAAMLGLIQLLARFGIQLDLETIQSYFDPGTALNMVGTTLRGLSALMSNGFLILLTVIFILAEASSFPRKLASTLSDPDQQMPYFNEFADNINRYMAIKATTSLFTGLIAWGFLSVIGIDHALLWGLVAFLLNFVPNIGSVLASIPPILLALVQFGPLQAGIVAVGYVVINVGIGAGVEPRFLGRGLGLSTLVVFLSLIFWGWTLGPVGMLLSVPLTMTAKIALEASPQTSWIGTLLGPADMRRTKPEAEPA